MSNEDDYEVGYGRPPKHSRFQKGTSGNTKGRPKGSKNLQTLLQQELDAQVAVNEQGRKKHITKRQVIIKQLVNKAAQGDLKAFQIVNELLPPEELRKQYDPEEEARIRETIYRKLMGRYHSDANGTASEDPATGSNAIQD
jgi:hypothetical protein